MPTTYEVGKPFPGPVPDQEGCVLEMGPDGDLVCLIQLPGLSRAEKQAFKKSFKRYGYLETGTEPPIAMWIWDWPEPLNEMDCNFDSCRVAQSAIDAFMTTWDWPEAKNYGKNAITFYLLDGPVLAGIKLVGLDPGAIMLFCDTIQKQRDMGYNQVDYDRALQGIYHYSTKELMGMAVQFRK